MDKISYDDFIAKDQWPPNSPDLKLTHSTTMCGVRCISQISVKAKNHPRAKNALQQIWDDLPQTTINKAINKFCKRLNACDVRFGPWWTF